MRRAGSPQGWLPGRDSCAEKDQELNRSEVTWLGQMQEAGWLLHQAYGGRLVARAKACLNEAAHPGQLALCHSFFTP